MEFKEIIFKVKDRIAILTLNRPDIRNAITGSQIILEIETACQKVNENQNISVLILTGADPAFSSGGNIKDMAEKKGMFKGTPVEIMQNYRQYVQRIPLAIKSVEVPTIAAVNGPAIGAGCDLTLMCDMRIASIKAKFGETFLNVGLIPGDGGAWFLPKVVGLAKACELTFTGEVIDAESALKIGMVNYVVAHNELMEKSMELALKIASKPLEALKMAKRLIYMGQQSTLSDHLAQTAAFQAICHQSKDHKEALSAIFEKRKPFFKGD